LRLDGKGAKVLKRIGSNFTIQYNQTGNHAGVALAGLPSGGFLVTWAEDTNLYDSTEKYVTAPGYSIFAQQFRAKAASAVFDPIEIDPHDVDERREGYRLAIAALSDETFVAAWSDRTRQTIHAHLLPGRYYDHTVQVNSEPIDPIFPVAPAIIPLQDEAFVVFWSAYRQASPVDSSGSAIKARLFGPGAEPVGAEFLVNTATQGDQQAPSGRALAGGGFVIAWEDLSEGVGGASGDASGMAVKAQVFAEDASRVGSEILVNTAVTGDQGHPQVMPLGGGGFVVTWYDRGQRLGLESAFLGQVFSATGAKVGSAFPISPGPYAETSTSRELAGGGLVIAWIEPGSGALGDDFEVKLKVFDANGAPVGTEVLVATVADAAPRIDVAGLDGGGFVVTWDAAAIKAQAYDATGAAIDGEIVVSTASVDQRLPQIVSLPDDGFAVVWADERRGRTRRPLTDVGLEISAQLLSLAP
jgi:hypothetical protein